MNTLKTVGITLAIVAGLTWVSGLTALDILLVQKVSDQNETIALQRAAINHLAVVQNEDRAAINHNSKVEQNIVKAVNTIVDVINSAGQSPASKDNTSIARGK